MEKFRCEAPVFFIDASGTAVKEESSEATQNGKSLGRARNWILLEHGLTR